MGKDEAAARAELFAELLEVGGHAVHRGKGGSVVSAKFAAKGRPGGMEAEARFGEDSLQLRVPRLAAVPEGCLAQALSACNEANGDCWAKFRVGEGGIIEASAEVALPSSLSVGPACEAAIAATASFLRDVGSARPAFRDFDIAEAAGGRSRGAGEDCSFLALIQGRRVERYDAVATFEADGRKFVLYTDGSAGGGGATDVHAAYYAGSMDSRNEDGVAMVAITPVEDKEGWKAVRREIEKLLAERMR